MARFRTSVPTFRGHIDTFRVPLSVMAGGDGGSVEPPPEAPAEYFGDRWFGPDYFGTYFGDA